MKILLIHIIRILSRFIPTKNIVIFDSVPDYADNSYALYKYMLNVHLNKKYKLIWYVTDKNKINNISKQIAKDGENCYAIYKFRIISLWYFIRARYIFSSHGTFNAFQLNQEPDKFICLWHGMPLKSIGATIQQPCAPNSNYTIATSETFQKIMSEAFAKPIDNVLITGQPRNDLLFEESTFLQRIKLDKSKYKSVGIWMPTYRKSDYGEIRLDGTYKDDYISIIKISELPRLNEFLAENGHYLFIKIHTMDVLKHYAFSDFSNIKIIKPQDFSDQLYPLLGSCDYLITDYSSVFIDYDILNRPIGFAMNDVEKYKNTRGLYFSDLEETLPGPILRNYTALVDFIHHPIRKNSNIELNKFSDANASMRVLSSLSII